MAELCTLCPRNCAIDRKEQNGFCSAPENAVVAKTMLHQWEEPCICYGSGSGAVFFSGCQLKCVFCQNHEISCKITGVHMTPDDLSSLFLDLERQGACNVNLVSATPHLNSVIPALKIAKAKGLTLPIVYNSGGYEKISTLRRLEGLVDIYLPDFKFYSPALSLRFADAKDYADVASKAIEEMYRQTGDLVFDKKENLKRGLMIRHLVLPGCTIDSKQVLNHLSQIISPRSFILSLMNQYIPVHKAKNYPPLNRKLTTLEYDRIVKEAERKGFEYLYTQKKSSANADFIPDFSRSN